jgi:hypothetical protein
MFHSWSIFFAPWRTTQDYQHRSYLLIRLNKARVKRTEKLAWIFVALLHQIATTLQLDNNTNPLKDHDPPHPTEKLKPLSCRSIRQAFVQTNTK